MNPPGTASAGAGPPRAAIGRTQAAAVVLAFAYAYFLAALLRAVTATLAPVFSAELALQSADLGLLAGAYFLGFAALQLPLGRALDRHGPRRVLIVLLGVAVLGCAASALAAGLASLIAARLLIGMGVSACLMAPLTCYRHLFGLSTQLRLNSWMLMTGSLGMVASTLPVQWLLPHWGWRGLFVALALLLAAALAAVAWLAPRGTATAAPAAAAAGEGRYRDIMRQPLFVALAPLGFFAYGGMIAVQALWAGPWLTQVTGLSAAGAAEGLFAINSSMLFAFMAWGWAMPRLARRGVHVPQLIGWGLPLSMLVLAAIVVLGDRAGAAWWALWCVSSTIVSLGLPAVAQALPAAWAGRALSAFNLVIFAGVFCLQWGIGVLIDALQAAGWPRPAAFQGAFAVFALCCVLAQGWFLFRQRRIVIIEHGSTSR